jgi:hypothetical protein
MGGCQALETAICQSMRDCTNYKKKNKINKHLTQKILCIIHNSNNTKLSNTNNQLLLEPLLNRIIAILIIHLGLL